MNEKRLLERFLEFIQIDSPTTKEREFAEHLIPILEGLGMEVEMDDAGEKAGSNSGNLIGKLKGKTGSPAIMFSAHMDTVSPGEGIVPVIKDGVIYSDGTTILGGDDKAGIAAIIEGIQSVVESGLPHGDIEVVFTIFEEGGLFGSKYLDYSKLDSKMAYVLDTSGAPGKIVVGGPAQAKITAEFTGKEAHAGVAPEEGISAIQMMAEAISNMKLLRVDEETTANIGKIEGGSVTNIVTKTAKFLAEARSLNDDKLDEQTAHMVEECEKAAKKYGGSVEVDVNIAYKSFRVDENAPIVQNVKKACENLGLKAETELSGGGSDTSNYNGNGIVSVNLAIGETKPHTVDESLKIEDLNNSAKLVMELIKLHA